MKTCKWERCNKTFYEVKPWQEFCCTRHQQDWHLHQRRLARQDRRYRQQCTLNDNHIGEVREAITSLIEQGRAKMEQAKAQAEQAKAKMDLCRLSEEQQREIARRMGLQTTNEVRTEKKMIRRF